MRVVSGSAKGRSLKAVPGMGTRPTTDRVKEAMFSRIGPYFEGGLVLDLFAGTGSLGIEALSRGMEQGFFIDNDRSAIRIIESNLKQTGLSAQAEVFHNDAMRALKALANRNIKFDLVLIDPPYEQKVTKSNAANVDAIIDVLESMDMLGEDALIVIEHDTSISYSERYGKVILLKQTNYGDTALSVYKIRSN